MRAPRMHERCRVFECQGDTLVGIVHEPEGLCRDVGVLIIVGGPQYRVGSHRQFVLLARGLAAAGYPVLRFDYRGMGDSSGESRSFEAVESDIAAALDAMAEELPKLRGIILFGLCDAASAALMYPADDTRVVGLILANPWARTDGGEAQAYLQHYYGQRLLQRAFWAKLFSGRVDFRNSVRGLSSSLGRMLRARADSDRSATSNYLERMLTGVSCSKRPLLLLMSGRDLTAREFDNLCRRSPRWARHISAPNVHRFDLQEADHTFSNGASQDRATLTAIQWLKTLSL